MKPATAPNSTKAPMERANFSHELHETIRLCAYELYEQRGRVDGHDLDDWLQAEAELTRVKVKKAAA